MTASIYQSSTPRLHVSESSASQLPRSCPLWPSTSRVIFHGNSRKADHEWSQEWENARTDRWVISKDLLIGAPRLVPIDEHHHLEVQSTEPGAVIIARSGGGGVHNNVFFEDLIWSPVAFPWYLEAMAYNSP